MQSNPIQLTLMLYSINQSASQMLQRHVIFTTLGAFGMAYFGYSVFSNLSLNKFYQDKIHREIKQIINDYSENVKKNNYKIDENTKKHVIAFRINNFKPNKGWQIDLSNKKMIDAINNLSLSNVSITVSKYPYYNRVIIERDNLNNIKLSFDD
jgi:hypothetical protein